MIHGILLAGGRSSRMGTDKALLPVEGKPLIRHICDNLLALCADVTVVVASLQERRYADVLSADTDSRIRFAEDRYPGKGPLAGIHAGLSAIPEAGYGFIMACDMPHVSVPLYREMVERLDGSVGAVLCAGQPFHAFYHKRVAQTAEACLRDDRLRLQAFYAELQAVYVEPDGSGCFENWNAPADYEAYLRKLRGG
ncbi:molybdenum cofactor guanylyltransferase [Paenibacillus sp. MBLB4367]|uniref:molybdenum cofactor guanylyltransferase n=1 Tax=Paenibacillus sp. MBLB4367 TaxID=3384767 RepID=UPI003907F55A